MTEAFSLHEKYMKRCLELAARGLGRTGSNPLVGSVIVHNDRIIGEGYHREFGGPHAEVVAIRSVEDKSLLGESVLYVNLEPCSHQGKTPPCSVLITEMKIPKVVMACMDPNPLVSGSGFRMLKDRGTEVITGILGKEAEFLNRRFIKYISKRQPYVILKWAESSDGYLDKIRQPGELGAPNWITNETARMLVHKWRSEEMAIMAGVNTILTDNPKLNVRTWPGNHPCRIIVDRNNRIGSDYHVMDGSLRTLVFSSRKKRKEGNTEFIEIQADADLNTILNMLGQREIVSLMVEGGAKLLNEFINHQLWDEARVFTGNLSFQEGVSAPHLPKPATENINYRNNRLKIYQRID